MGIKDQRQFIGAALHGDVLEIGPGARPFPTAAGARVRYADRSVPGGRGANWPELSGAPSGPDADYDVHLDEDGLRMLVDASQDALVASHVIEHLVNPIAALTEFQRVLRPGGLLVLIVPDREHTFDWVRTPTSFTHLWGEFQAGVRELSREHVLEFCRAISMQPAIHPPQVRAWHDPRVLNDALLQLHRRRSIHVHCWAPEEFASLLACLLARGTLHFELLHAYTVDDLPGGAGDEFGLLLRRTAPDVGAGAAAESFVNRWCQLMLDSSRPCPPRLLRLAALLRRDMPGMLGPSQSAVPVQALAARGLRPSSSDLRPRDLKRVLLRLRQAAAEIVSPLPRITLPGGQTAPH